MYQVGSLTLISPDGSYTVFHANRVDFKTGVKLKITILPFASTTKVLDINFDFILFRVPVQLYSVGICLFLLVKG